jgi:hypothetical protein
MGIGQRRDVLDPVDREPAELEPAARAVEALDEAGDRKTRAVVDEIGDLDGEPARAEQENGVSGPAQASSSIVSEKPPSRAGKSNSGNCESDSTGKCPS